MTEYRVEIPELFGTVGLAIADELVHSWRAEVLEYDVTASRGVISVAIPDDREIRIARCRDQVERVSCLLALSDAIVHDARNQLDEARATLDETGSYLAA
jgi:hypothetical protein